MYEAGNLMYIHCSSYEYCLFILSSAVEVLMFQKIKPLGVMPWDFTKLIEKKWRNTKIFFFQFPVTWGQVHRFLMKPMGRERAWHFPLQPQRLTLNHTIAFSRSRLLNFWKQVYSVNLFVSQRHTCLSRERRIMWNNRKLTETENKFAKTFVPSLQIS